MPSQASFFTHICGKQDPPPLTQIGRSNLYRCARQQTFASTPAVASSSQGAISALAIDRLTHIDDYMDALISDVRLPRYQRLRDHLAAEISAQTWRPGDLIPSEAELAAGHGISIGTVRRAIEQLVAEGLLDRQQGRGTFVRRAKFNSSLFRFFRFQSETGERKVPRARILHRKLLPAPSAVAAMLWLHEGAEVINLSRVRLIDGEPLLAEEIWLDASRFAAVLTVDAAAFGDLLYPLYEEQCGQIVATASEVLTVEAASRMQARLLARPPGAPLIVIDRTAFDPERRPIEWRRSRGPADRFRYHAEIR